MESLEKKYLEEVGKIITSVQQTSMKDIDNTIAQAGRLGKLSQATLQILSSIELTLDSCEGALKNQDFIMRQEYALGRYKQDTAVSSHHWDYYGRHNFVWAG